MKLKLLIACLMVGSICYGQKIQLPLNKDSLVEFSQIVRLQDSSKTKSDLYNSARMWFANSFNNSKYVLQIDDKESGHLLAKCSEKIFSGLSITNDTYVNYSVEVMVRNGKFKYRVYDIYLTGAYQYTLTHYYIEYIKDKMKQDIFESKKAVIRRYELLINNCINKIDPICKSLVYAMNTSKSDDF